MKKFTTLALALLAVLTLGAVAFAQTNPLTVTGSGSPKKSGTKKKPANTTTEVGFSLDPSIKQTLTQIEYTFPKAVKISGAGFPTCTTDDIATEGEAACPAKSKVGTGTAKAFARTSQIDYKFNIYAAGPKAIALELTGGVDLPAFPGKISGSKLTVQIPSEVQQPIPGLYSTVESITAKLGTKAVTKGKGKKKKTYRFVSTVGCSGGKHTVGVKLSLANGATPTASQSGSVDIPCSKGK